MKLIIAGSRHINLITQELDDIINEHKLLNNLECIISGGARGVDTTAHLWALENKIEFMLFKAFWAEQGRGAGHIRNNAMAKAGDVLLLIWDGYSAGSRSMKKYMMKSNKTVIEIIK